MPDIAIWTSALAAAFVAGMVAQAAREARRPIPTTADRPDDNVYVPTIDEEHD